MVALLARRQAALVFGLVLALGACESDGSDPGPSGPAQTGGRGGGTAGGTGGVSGGGSGGTSPGSGGSTSGTGGTGGGQGGTGGSSTGGSGGAGLSDAAAGQGGSTGPKDGPVDTTAPGEAGGDALGSPDTGPAAPLMECATPSLDRFQRWVAHALISGAAPASSLLVKEGDRYVARARFPGGGFSEAVVGLANSANLEQPTDLSTSTSLTISYSATAELWLQLRGTVQPHGGNQHHLRLPATAGKVETKSFPLTADAWTFHPQLGRPTVLLPAVLKAATIINLVGNTANMITVAGLRFDKYVPPCR